MTTPLRWAYRDSYRYLESLARAHGVHPFEYQALVESRSGRVLTVTIQKGPAQWEKDFGPDDLTRVTDPVMAFFSVVVEDMVRTGQRAYQEALRPRGV